MIEIETEKKSMAFLANACINVDMDLIQQNDETIRNKEGKGVCNSQKFVFWDYKYNTILFEGPKYGFVGIKIYRGKLWTAVSAYNPKTKELFLIFSKKNLNRIMREQSGKHYAPIANLVNGDLLPYVHGRQLSLDLYEYDTGADIIHQYEQQYDDFIEELGVKPRKTIICTFENDPVKTFEAFIYNKNQEISWYKDYSDLIEVDYSSEIQHDDVAPSEIRKINKKLYTKKTKRIKGLK